MSSLELRYGKNTIPVHLKHPYTVYTPQLPEPAKEPQKMVALALDRPIGSLPLERLVRPGERVVIVLSDITRPVPYQEVLPPLLDRLADAAISREDMVLLFANGTHRGMTAADAARILGQKQAKALRWVNHDAHDRNNLVYLGETSRGTPVWLNRLAVEADHVILTGAVVHHYFAGFGGGRKCLVPGVAGIETVLANHRLALGPTCTGSLDSACMPGVLEGNPVHEDIMEACALHPPSFLLNVVLDPSHRILYAAAGDWQAAHAACCRVTHDAYGVQVDRPAELVIASCGGFPKDINMIQAHKTFDNAFRAVKPGGVLVLLAECAEGIGSGDFLAWFAHQDPFALEQALRAAYAINGHTALACLAKAQAVSAILVSALEPSLVRRLGLHPAGDIHEALRSAYRLLGTRSPLTYVFPYGSLTVPWLAPPV